MAYQDAPSLCIGTMGDYGVTTIQNLTPIRQAEGLGNNNRKNMIKDKNYRSNKINKGSSLPLD